MAAISVVSFGFRHRWAKGRGKGREVLFSFPLQSPWENERPISLGSPAERANFSIPWRWSAIIEPRDTSQTQDIKSRLRSRTSDSRFDSLPRMVHYPIVIGIGHRAKSLAVNKFDAIAERPIDISRNEFLAVLTADRNGHAMKQLNVVTPPCNDRVQLQGSNFDNDVWSSTSVGHRRWSLAAVDKGKWRKFF